MMRREDAARCARRGSGRGVRQGAGLRRWDGADDNETDVR